jgi:ankyrin repeat protein
VGSTRRYGEDTNKASLEDKDIKYPNRTALDIACAEQQDDIAILLIAAGATSSPAVSGTDHAIHLVSKNGLIHHVQELITRNPELVHARDKYNQTPLLWAASRGHDEVVAFLIAQGADVNLATQHKEKARSNYSPLDWAIEGKHDLTISILDKAGAIANHGSTVVQSVTKKAVNTTDLNYRDEELPFRNGTYLNQYANITTHISLACGLGVIAYAKVCESPNASLILGAGAGLFLGGALGFGFFTQKKRTRDEDPETNKKRARMG